MRMSEIVEDAVLIPVFLKARVKVKIKPNSCL